MMRRNALFSTGLLLYLLGCAGVLLAGCSASDAARTAQAPSSRIDSLQTANERLQARIRLLSDSLQFYDDIQSGQCRRERRALQDDLTRLAYEAQLLREGGQTVATIAADVLFEAGTAQLRADASSRLRAVASQLHTTYRERTVRVESHTASDAPADSTYSSVWALSAAQSAAVVDALIALSNRPPAQFRALAYGSAQPVASNATAPGRARNRRIRIAVLPRAVPIAHPYETAW